MIAETQLVPIRSYGETLSSAKGPCSVFPGQAEPASKEGSSMARRRYQTGRVFKRGKRNPVWIGRYREDAIQPDGKTGRIYRSIILGPVSQLTEKQARRVLEPYLARVNSIDYRPERFAKIGEFSETWEREVLQQQKPSSIKAARSYLRIYIRPLLGEMRLEDFSVRAQQSFVTRLSQAVSRKTVVNILSTLRSILRTAKSWGYSCHTLDFAQLALPVAEDRKDARFFTGEQAQRILSVAPEPYRTMFAVAAMTGLRAGEVMALQKSDFDLERGLLHVRRSAWYGRVQSVKTKASRAPVAMPQALVEIVKQYLVTWKPNFEGFLFVNRKGRPYSANKVVEYGLWPILEALEIPRAGMHAFRHCHASLLVDVGANPKVTQQQMRHSDARITLDVYSHVIGDAQRNAVEKVGEMLRPNAKFCAQMRPN